MNRPIIRVLQALLGLGRRLAAPPAVEPLEEVIRAPEAAKEGDGKVVYLHAYRQHRQARQGTDAARLSAKNRQMNGHTA